VSTKLIVLAGPLKNSEFILSSEDLGIGRDPSNPVAVPDPSISRRHCVVMRDGERLKVRDLDSRNGTFVNGLMVKESWLDHGDQISVGDSIIAVVCDEESSASLRTDVEFEDGMTHATARLRPQDVLYLQPERVLQELPSAPNLARNLSALLKISRVVHSIGDLDELQSRLLQLIFETVPAEHGAILLDSRGSGEFASVFARHRVSRSDEPVRISRTITAQVVDQGVAVLGSDIPSSGTLSTLESIVALNIRSLMCVPLTVVDSVIGCIYLDTTLAESFDEDHLQLLTAIAGISAIALANARRLQWLEQENVRLNAEINLEHNMVGSSPKIREIYQFLARVSPGDSTVLIEGESGTGKEVVARAIHRNSPRHNKPFVAINCAAIPETLLESELFGYEKGAFTGAVSQKKGKFEAANGGVVFLDEIGELAPSLQVKLLRVLQEREFERVGGVRPIAIDIRLIAATNKDLREAVKDGSFRQDLFYRLNVVSLVMPTLRERREDIPMLAEYFVTKFAKKSNMKPKQISAEAMSCLLNYDWPGNVRELENAMERALVMSASDSLRADDLPEVMMDRGTAAGASAKYHNAVKELKKQLILGALKEAQGSYTDAARTLGVHPNYLHRLIRNLELKDSIRVMPGTLTQRAAAKRL
jgi:Nif-specific regulatory protein